MDMAISDLTGPRIIIEAKVPFLRGLFERQGCTVRYLAAGDITREAVADADALITRTRTRCDQALLDGSRCRIVATATIGTDHIDTGWCEANGIRTVNAPGCNAPAVAQYVMRAVIDRFGDRPQRLAGLTLGVIGVGHVGSIVARWAKGLGMKVLLCDPPRAAREGAGGFVPASDLARMSDIVTVHTPLTRDPAPWPTYHLLGRELIAAMTRRPLVINSARGAVADTEALIEGFDSGAIGALAIDCWEGEPDIDRRLLERCMTATPHIAGYSVQGKQRASQAAADAVADALGLARFTIDGGRPADSPSAVTAAAITATCELKELTQRLKESPAEFEHMRDHYTLRNEPSGTQDDYNSKM